jgi:hypothetical protein
MRVSCQCRDIRSLETVMHIPFALCDDFTVLAQSLKGYSTHCGAGRVGGWNGGRRTKGKSRKAWFAGVAVA